MNTQLHRVEMLWIGKDPSHARTGSGWVPASKALTAPEQLNKSELIY